MARPRTFDENALLTNAMHVFRRRGYAATTVRDLEAATGLTSGTLYNAYGDKRGLFEAASAHYQSAVLQRRLHDHAPPGSGLRGLRSLFSSLLREPGGTTHGCLITNSAIEFGCEDPPALVPRGFEMLCQAFRDRLEEAGVANPRARATELLALYQGILVLVRGGYGNKHLSPMIRQAFDRLEASQ